MSRKRDRLLAVVASATLCVVGIGALQIALSSDRGKQGGGGGSEGGPTRYVDPTYGFSLVVDSRFAGSTAPGLTIESGYYVKSWNADDSPTSGVQPLDTFGVSVLDRPAPVARRVVDAELRTILNRPSAYVSGWGENARVDEVEKSEVDGQPAVLVEGRFVGLAGVRVRGRQVVVPMTDRFVVLTSISTPATWRRNLSAFESMVASFRLPPDARGGRER